MKKFYLLSVFLLSFAIYAQKDINVGSQSSVFNSAGLDVQPEYPGGIVAFQKFIANKFNERNFTPETDDIKIFAQFIINEDGTLSDIKILRANSNSISNEIAKIISESPKWSPGSIKGKVVKSRYNVPIIIKRKNAQREIKSTDSFIDDNVATPDFARKTVKDDEDKVYIMPDLDEVPKFPGGTDAFMKLFDKNFDKSKVNLLAYALVDIIVEKDGSLTVSVSKATNDIVKAEAERVLKSLPKWSPAKRGGQPVRTTFLKRFEIRKP